MLLFIFRRLGHHLDRHRPGRKIDRLAALEELLSCFISCFFFSSRRRHTRSYGDWSSDVALPIFYLAANAIARIRRRWIAAGVLALTCLGLWRVWKYGGRFLDRHQGLFLVGVILLCVVARSEERRVGKVFWSRLVVGRC